MSAVLTPSGIYKLDFIRKNKIRYSETPGAAFQDHGFWFKTHLLAEKVMFIDKAFYLYRFDNPNSSIYKKNSLDIMGKEYDSIAEFVKQHPELAYAGVPFYWKEMCIRDRFCGSTPRISRYFAFHAAGRSSVRSVPAKSSFSSS